MKKIIVAVVAATSALLLSPGVANADGYYTPGEKAVAAAMSDAICGYIDSHGVTMSSMTTVMRAVYQQDEVASYGDAVDVINYAVENYCPRHWQELVSFGEGIRGAS